jgi:hypothetical protein
VSGRSYLKVPVAAGAVQGYSATVSRAPHKSITKRGDYIKMEKTSKIAKFVKSN